VSEFGDNVVGAPTVEAKSRTYARWPSYLGALDTVMVVLAAALNWPAPLPLLVAFAVSVPMLALAAGIYTTGLRFDPATRVPHLIGVVTVASMGLVTIQFMGYELGATPEIVLRLWFTTVGLILVGRLVAAPLYAALFRHTHRRKALIIGSGFAAVLVADKIETHPEFALETVGFIDDGPRQSVRGRSEPLLGTVDRIHELIDSSGAEVVIFGYTHNTTDEMLIALYQMPPKVEVLMMPRFFQFVSAGMKVQDLAGLPLLALHRRELTPSERVLKRAEDLVIGGLAALLVLPFAPFIALAIKLDSPGPIFFKHERIGRWGKPFQMYKFRSMVDQSEQDEEALGMLAIEDPRGLKNKADMRVTKVGAFLRKSSIDELPQLINVIRGDMSLVGPRPAVAEEVAAYDEWQKKRLSVAPGITGLWQVSGRSDVPFDERIWLDFMYIDSWSLYSDLSIVLKTIPAVLSAKGAY
jgi:exopolysaccharide biosynthesis polyprenyl glycosylphosphotransferase